MNQRNENGRIDRTVWDIKPMFLKKQSATQSTISLVSINPGKNFLCKQRITKEKGAGWYRSIPATTTSINRYSGFYIAKRKEEYKVSSSVRLPYKSQYVLKADLKQSVKKRIDMMFVARFMCIYDWSSTGKITRRTRHKRRKVDARVSKIKYRSLRVWIRMLTRTISPKRAEYQ